VTTSADLQVYLVWYDANFNQYVTQGLRHGNAITVATGALTPAEMNRYFVAIFGDTVASYAIDVEATAAGCTDSGEPNDNASQAVTLPANAFTGPLSLCGDDDWFTVT